MSDWRVAKSLEVLRDQLNQMAPARSKASDGTIAGDAHHQANPSSDHEPWIVDDRGLHVVSALDITHDPHHGVDCGVIAEALRASKDKRIKYIIWNRRICNSTVQPWMWRKYIGKSPHTEHIHISVKSNQPLYDDRDPWQIGELVPDPQAPPQLVRPQLKRGAIGAAVEQLQELLKITADGQFGPATEKAVRQFQRDHDLVDDGVVGLYTWKAIEGSKA